LKRKGCAWQLPCVRFFGTKTGLALAVTAAGCDEPVRFAAAPADPGWLADVEMPLPERLSQVGLFSDVEARVPAPDLRPYTPLHPLWSNGADKERLLYLPPGGRIEPGDDGFDFPVGTVLAKTFTLPDLEGRLGTVPIETRLLYRTRTRWSYAEYVWSADGSDADLLERDWAALGLRLTDAAGQTFRYTLPGAVDCESCHGAPGDSPVLGISRWQQPPEVADLYSRPPETAELPARTPLEGEVIGYVQGNCAFCHHGRRTGDNASFSLLPQDFVANTVNRETESSASGVGVRVVPGDADGSAVFQAVVEARSPDYTGDLKPMPPVGIERIDPRAERILRAWIEAL